MAKRLSRVIGINDAEYPVDYTVNGKRIRCPYHSKWQSMIQRCYDEKHTQRRPTYRGCQVTESWHRFTVFKSWMETQDWQGKELDKDLVGDGRLYSQENCVFVSRALNLFTIDSGASRGAYPIGVTTDRGRFKSELRIDGTRKHLGCFGTPEEAHLAWVAAKTKLAERFISTEQDPRVIHGIRRYIQSIQPKKAESHDFESQAQLV